MNIGDLILLLALAAPFAWLYWNRRHDESDAELAFKGSSRSISRDSLMYAPQVGNESSRMFEGDDDEIPSRPMFEFLNQDVAASYFSPDIQRALFGSSIES
jgi:hypothetical protein